MSASREPPHAPHSPSTAKRVRTRPSSALGIGVALLLPAAGCVAFRAFIIVVFEVGNRNLAVLALIVAGLGFLLGIAALMFSSAGNKKTSLSLIAAAFLTVAVALVGAFSIHTHGE
jgi:hypothetical protein